MTKWANDELDRIGDAEELQLASMRNDGSLRPPVTMWVVREGEDIYVRAVNGRDSAWFRGAQARHEAHISAGGVEKDVDLVEIDAAYDAVYQRKYGGRYPTIVPSMVAPEARAATLELSPRTEEPR